jgi:hypothetical protein
VPAPSAEIWFSHEARSERLSDVGLTLIEKPVDAFLELVYGLLAVPSRANIRQRKALNQFHMFPCHPLDIARIIF